MNSFLQRTPFVSLVVCIVALHVAEPLDARVQNAAGRVVVLGFDGADARTVARMIEAGELPHMAKLASEGTFAPLLSTYPAESAAGWAAINTGTNPVKNNVPSFIKRDLATMSPGFAHIARETLPIGELEPRGLLGVLARYGGPGFAVGAGAAGVALSLLVLGGLLRLGWRVGLGLGLLVGGALGFAAHRAQGYVPAEVPDVNLNMVAQPGFWDFAAQAGKRAIVLEAALAFARPAPEGARVLAGLGVPDVRGGTNGYWFLYTTDEFASREGKVSKSNTGFTYRVDEKEGRVETWLYGPRDFGVLSEERIDGELAELDRKLAQAKGGWKETQALRDERSTLVARGDAFRKGDDAGRARVPLTIERRGERLAVAIDGQSQELGQDEWSDWYRVSFELNSLMSVHAVTRVRILSLRDPLSIYVDTLHIDPENPPFWQPASSPPDFSAELAGWIGSPFETLGWACMTNQIKDQSMPLEVFLEDIEFTLGFRRRLTQAALARSDWELLFSVFSTTDRVQHMMYQFYDPEHPSYDEAEANRVVSFFGKPTRLADAIPEIYRQMDAVIGEVRAKLAPEDTLLICADHGFTSYRRSVDVNNWLAENGYFALKDLSSERFSNIDWSRTKAFAMGLGMLYINLEGREPQGIVKKEDAIALMHEIGQRLVTELRDPGPEDAPYSEPRQAILDYVVMSELYQGPMAWDSPEFPCADVQLGTAEYYRSSWGSVSGNTRLTKVDNQNTLGTPFGNNTNPWSGDHASNSPHVVTGTFFCSRPVTIPAGGVSVMHIAPTVLALLGVERPPTFDLLPLDLRP